MSVGVDLDNVTLVVATTDPSGQAAAGGIAAGWKLLRIGGKSVLNGPEFRAMFTSLRAGSATTTKLTFLKPKHSPVTL
jgi:S1-C subfamily serine protease